MSKECESLWSVVKSWYEPLYHFSGCFEFWGFSHGENSSDTFPVNKYQTLDFVLPCLSGTSRSQTLPLRATHWVLKVKMVGGKGRRIQTLTDFPTSFMTKPPISFKIGHLLKSLELDTYLLIDMYFSLYNDRLWEPKDGKYRSNTEQPVDKRHIDIRVSRGLETIWY